MNLTTVHYTGSRSTLDLTDEIGHEIDLGHLPDPTGTYDVRIKDLGDGRTRIAYKSYDEDCEWEIPYMVEVHNFGSEEEFDAWVARREPADEEEAYHDSEAWTGRDETDPTFERFAVGYFGDSRIFDGPYSGLAIPSVALGNEDGFTDCPKAFESIVEEYRSWAEGYCFGLIVLEVENATGNILDLDGSFGGDHDACWGFIGDRYSDEVLERTIESGNIW